MICITKKIEFEAAHRLSNYSGACSQIHGHTYKLEVTLCGPIDPETDMIMDFKNLKLILRNTVLSHFDHSLILKDNPENRMIFADYSGKVTWMETEPTAERMIEWIVREVSRILPQGLALTKLKLYETSGSYASWEK
jgi:6-pyruvoyltetrahydropterin/6-carboxytetrahydropterin synthase